MVGLLRILDRNLGDRQIVLNKENMDEAKKEFDDAISKGYIAFETSSSGAKQLVKELNSDAEDIVMIMPMISG